MTRDESLKMEAGVSLDKLVAEKVMGWTNRYDHWWKGDDLDTIAGWSVCEGPDPFLGHDVFAPSTDIAAAWQVVDRMLADKDGKQRKFNLYRFFRRYDHGTKERVTWRLASGAGWCNLLEYVEADTAPLAICRAALLMEVENGND